MTVPIDVTSLVDPVNNNSGLSSASFVVFYNPSVVSIVDPLPNTNPPVDNDPSSDVPLRRHPQQRAQCQRRVGLGFDVLRGAAWRAGNLAEQPRRHSLLHGHKRWQHRNDQLPRQQQCRACASAINLAADTFGGPPGTGLTDGNFSEYTLSPSPQDGTTLNPYSYAGSSRTDGTIVVNGPYQLPVAGNDSYTATVGDANLTVPAATGVLAAATDPQGFALTVSSVNGLPANVGSTLTLASGATLKVNADGSFVYTPPVTFLGTDTFTYVANDGFANSANVGTVTVTVSPRLSIPTNMSGSPGGVVIVPVNINNADPQGSGGLVSATLAIDYNPNVFSVDATSGVQAGTVTSGITWNAPIFSVDATDGEIGIALDSSTPDLNSTGGSLVLITFKVLANAPAGETPINLAANNAPDIGGIIGSVTTVLDALNGALPLRPAVTNASNDPNVDGSVDIAATTHFSVVAPASVAAGVPFTFTVTALDQNNHVAPSYGGTVLFASSDSMAGLPTSATLTNGVGTFTGTLITLGNQTISAADSSNIYISGTSYGINVTSGATHYSVSAPANVAAGVPFVFEVTALDQNNDLVGAYAGTVHFTSSDNAAALPANATLTNGIGFFAAVLKTAGAQTIISADTVNGTITGTSAGISVSPGAVNHFAVSGPMPPALAITGSPATFTVSAEDAFSNVITNYQGTVHFSSSDAAATLPSDTTLTGGNGTFTATFQTTGNQTLTATDTSNSSLTGTSAPIEVRGLIVTSFTAMPWGFVATFSKPVQTFNSAADQPQLNLYDSSTANYGPADVTLTSSNNVRGSLLISGGGMTVTFIKTAAGSADTVSAPTMPLPACWRQAPASPPTRPPSAALPMVSRIWAAICSTAPTPASPAATMSTFSRWRRCRRPPWC